MLEKKKVVNIGVGNSGSLISSLFQEIFPKSKHIILSSAREDTETAIKNHRVDRARAKLIELKTDGNQKKFTVGREMWQKNLSKLSIELMSVENSIVIVWGAMGGGTASSSFDILAKVLKENNNHVYFVGIIPSIYERIPPAANLVMSANMAQNVCAESNVNTIVFDRNILDKRFENNLNNLDIYVVETVRMMFDLLDCYSTDGYSPITIDDSELESIFFAEYPGFMSIYFDDIKYNKKEEFLPHKHKFKSESNVKNLLVILMVNENYTNQEVDDINVKFQNLLRKYGRKYKSARFISGIVRTKGEGIRLYTIEHGLYPTEYFERCKNEAIEMINNNKASLDLTWQVEEDLEI